MRHQCAVIGLGVLGVGIASVVTVGAASAILAITAAGLLAVDFRTFFDAEVLDPNLDGATVGESENRNVRRCDDSRRQA